MSGDYWDKKMETAPRKELEKHQINLLKNQVRYCFENSIFYRKKFKKAGITPDSIKTLDDTKKIPFTYKNDFSFLLRILIVIYTLINKIITKCTNLSCTSFVQ